MGAIGGEVCADRVAVTNRHKPAIEERRIDMEKVYLGAGMDVKGAMLNE